MPEHPFVSVLMTAYNREKYIAQAIESVLASTYRNFELIIVDDASTDGTIDIAQQYAKADSRLQVYRNEKNLGQFPNRNYAASLAQGEYLKYVDSDDVIYPHGLEVMVDSIHRFPEAGLGLCHNVDDVSPYPVLISPRKAYQEHFLKESGLLNRAPLSAIFRTTAFQTVHGFPSRPYISDMGILLILAAQFPLVKMGVGLVWWRAHADQEFRLGQQAYPSLVFQTAVEALKDPVCPLTGEEVMLAFQRVKQRYARIILSNCAHGQSGEAWRLYRAIGLKLYDLPQGLRRFKPLLANGNQGQ